MGVLLSFGVAWAVFALGMLGAWVVERRTGNGGWVDVFWTLSLTTGTAAGVFAASRIGVPIELGYAATTLVMLMLWGGRLGAHLFARSGSKQDDPRYQEMRAAWGDRVAVQMLFNLQAQVILSLPLVITLLAAAMVPGPFEVLKVIPGIAIAGLGLVIGWKADRDLAIFKRSNKGLCSYGLWGWSRHPNYVGEIIFWAGIAALSLGHGISGAFAAVGPVAIYILLRFVSGVPMLERHMSEKYGEAFATYCETTPALFPWPLAHFSRTKSE
ncbi:MAG: DUF1295 domain-containing protein [Pseudomonadota bacterium]